MPLEGEGLVEPSSFPSIQLQRGGRSVSRHSNRVPLSIVHSYRRQPYIPLLGSQTVQIVAEVQSAVLDLEKIVFSTKFFDLFQIIIIIKIDKYLQDGVLPVVLVAYSEQFAVDLSSSESQLHLGGIFIRLEGQGVLNVTLRLERGWYGGRHAPRPGPSRVALASGLGEASHAGAVLPATERGLLIVAYLLGLGAAGHAVPGQAGMRQVVELAVVEQILDTPVETFADRHVLPLVVSRVELLHV